MSWIIVTEKLVNQRATLAELEANKAAAGALGDPLQGIIASTTCEIRAAIAEGGKTNLDDDPRTIPASLLNIALSIIVYRFASRVLSQETFVQDARYQEYARAMDALDEIRKGERTVEDPETDDFGDVSAGAEVAEADELRFTRAKFRLL